MRWLELIKDYDCTINYHTGKANLVDEALSRKERVNVMSLPQELIKEKKRRRRRSLDWRLRSQSIRREEFMRG